jgi:hypothetical protein
MTAEIIMNKKGVAIAVGSGADTMSARNNSRKVINTDNKIYPIPNHKVVATVFGKTDFYGIPLEVIMSMWHEYLPTQFNTVEEYAEKFIECLKNICYHHLPEDKKAAYLEMIIIHIFTYALSKCREDYNDLTIDKLTSLLDKLIDKLNHFEDVKHAHRMFSLIMGHESMIKNIVSEVLSTEPLSRFDIYPDDKFYAKLIKLIYLLSSKNHDLIPGFGVVITGYGRDDIFPGVISYNIYGFLGGEIIYSTIDNYKISIDSSPFVESYCQDEDIILFLMGSNNIILGNYVKLLKNILSKKLENRDDAPISEIIDEFSNQAVEYNKKEFYLPIMHVIDSSSPEDLAMLAESLVNLSTIRKKYTMNDDDETACGPVDVAIITKKDGFQWIKKK